MPNSSTIVGSSRRGGPTFKFYWVENGQITAIKRRDESAGTIHSGTLFFFISEAFPQFNRGEHAVKFQDENDLVDLKPTDPVFFNADSGDMQIYVYIFTSKEEAARTICPPISGSTPSPMSQSSSTQVSFPSPAVVPTLQPQSEATVSQPEVSAAPQPAAVLSEARANEGTQRAPNLEASNGSSNERLQLGNDFFAPGPVHERIVCDGCNGSIPTHRYKCIQCPDFDLCANCEANGLHPEHLMVRVPLHFVRTYGADHRDILRRMLNAFSSEFPDDVVIDLGRQLKDVLKVFGIELDHIGEGKHCDGRRRGHKARHCPFASADKRPDYKHHPLFRRCHRRETREEQMRAYQATETRPSDTASSGPAPTPSAPAPPHSAPAPTPSAPAAPASAPSMPVPTPVSVPDFMPVPTPVSAPSPAPVAQSAPTTVTDAPVYPLLDISCEVVPMEEDAHRPGEWLIVESDGAAAATVKTPAPKAAQTVAASPFLHTDDEVNLALEKLAVMGYRIDDPLLVNVVEDCKGDLTRILDCLHG